MYASSANRILHSSYNEAAGGNNVDSGGRQWHVKETAAFGIQSWQQPTGMAAP